MRWASDGGTRPSNTKRSVPRLIAVHMVATRASSGPSGRSVSRRKAVARGASIHRASPLIVSGGLEFFTALNLGSRRLGPYHTTLNPSR